MRYAYVGEYQEEKCWEYYCIVVQLINDTISNPPKILMMLPKTLMKDNNAKKVAEVYQMPSRSLGYVGIWETYYTK